MGRNLFIIFTALLLSSDISAKNDEHSFKLMVIHSYRAGSWTTESTQGIVNLLKERRIKYELTDRIFDYYAYVENGPDSLETESNKLLSEVKNQKPDLIFIFDDEASDSLIPRLNALNIPIVAAGINKEPEDLSWWKADGSESRNFTAVLERYPFAQSIRMLKRMNPKISRISLLTGSNQSAKVITRQLENFFKSQDNEYSGIRYEKTFMSSQWKDWQEAIRSYQGDDRSFWIVSPWNVNDENGKEVDLRKIGAFYHENSKLPTLAIASVNQKLGFLASFAVNPEDLGYQAGDVALRVLVQRQAPRNIPFEENKTIRFVINKLRADALGYEIPIELLEFATIEKKIPMEFVR